MVGWIGAALFTFSASVARADTGDTGDTGRHVDTGARAELVYTQDVGCGGAAAALTTLTLLFGTARRRGARAGRRVR